MSKKPCFRQPFDSQHAKKQTLFKSAVQHFYDIFLSLKIEVKLNWKMSLLLLFR